MQHEYKLLYEQVPTGQQEHPYVYRGVWVRTDGITPTNLLAAAQVNNDAKVEHERAKAAAWSDGYVAGLTKGKSCTSCIEAEKLITDLRSQLSSAPWKASYQAAAAALSKVRLELANLRARNSELNTLLVWCTKPLDLIKRIAFTTDHSFNAFERFRKEAKTIVNDVGPISVSAVPCVAYTNPIPIVKCPITAKGLRCVKCEQDRKLVAGGRITFPSSYIVNPDPKWRPGHHDERCRCAECKTHG